MDLTTVLQELETLAESLAVEMRYDDLEGRGGLCRYGGRTCLIVNRALPVGERVRVISDALARLPLEDIFVRPQVRELLERHSVGQGSKRS
ncbi:MAG: hypothetical protein WDA75_01810 [Candidatus Latescibacterota bacterium]|jgi:hypothetical protein